MNVHDWAFVIVLVLVLIGFIVFWLTLNTARDLETEERLEELEDRFVDTIT